MIETSETTDKIGPAFLAAQKAIGDVVKASKNPAFKKANGQPISYANLSDVIEALKGPLNDNGLFMLCPLVEAKRDNHTACQVYVGHAESGQFFTSVFELAVDKQTPQGFGSAGTYTQRYALNSFFCLEQEDDDGNTASKTATKAAPSAVIGAATPAKPADPPITDEQRTKLNAIRASVGQPPFTGAMVFSELTPAVQALNALKKKEEPPKVG